MNNKISWVELRRAIAVSMGASEKEVAPFLNALTEQIIEALKTEHQVRIGGLGNFRLQAIAPRKSVNVVTGEAWYTLADSLGTAYKNDTNGMINGGTPALVWEVVPGIYNITVSDDITNGQISTKSSSASAGTTRPRCRIRRTCLDSGRLRPLYRHNYNHNQQYADIQPH